MARDRRQEQLDALDEIEDDLSSRTGKASLAYKPKRNEGGSGSVIAEVAAHERKAGAADTGEEDDDDDDTTGASEGGGGGMDDDEAKEVERHLVESGQWDCPHCGKSMKTGEAE